MSLYPDPIDGLIAAINSQNDLTLSRADYQFGAPLALETPTAEANTQVTLTPTGVQAAYDGVGTFTYKRLNLADLTTLLGPITVPAYLPTTTLSIAEALNQSFGTNLSSDDIVSGALSLTDGAGSVTLVAKATSLMWIGQVTVNVIKGNYPLGHFVTNLRLPGLNYPAPTTTKPFGYAYSYWRDFSSQAAELAKLTVGTNGLNALAAILVAVTKDKWIIDSTNRFSLQGAKISYAGPSSGNPSLNQRYTYGVVVDLDPDKCLGYAGQLILHFSFPTDD